MTGGCGESQVATRHSDWRLEELDVNFVSHGVSASVSGLFGLNNGGLLPCATIGSQWVSQTLIHEQIRQTCLEVRQLVSPLPFHTAGFTYYPDSASSCENQILETLTSTPRSTSIPTPTPTHSFLHLAHSKTCPIPHRIANATVLPSHSPTSPTRSPYKPWQCHSAYVYSIGQAV
jgi:hypothetical protein